MTVDPNFLIIGAQKCGTTWLSGMVSQHPDIYTAPRKELHFFDKQYNYEKGINWYRTQFNGYSGEKAVGESTPNYFWVNLSEEEIIESSSVPNVPQILYNHYPYIKLILIFRDPVQRAISAYYHHIAKRRVSPNKPIREVWHRYGIISMGFYYSQLREWLKFFKINQFLILIYELDIAKNRERTMGQIFKFLAVNDNFRPVGLDKKRNVRQGHLYMRVNYLFPKLAKKIFSRIGFLRESNFPKIHIKPKEIEEMEKIYAVENYQLTSLIKHDISAWGHLHQ